MQPNKLADWAMDMMASIRAWDLSSEVVGKRKFTYLIGGEAFDYLSLLERLAGDPKTNLKKSNLEELLFYGHLPSHGMKDEIKNHLGWKKYRAYLNYWYGVVIEQCLQYVVEIEVAKEFRAKGISEPNDLGNIVFHRLYGEESAVLFRKFCCDTKRTYKESLTVAELEEYTYWLSKYRFEESDQSRFASDTLKGLSYFESLNDRMRSTGSGCVQKESYSHRP